MPTWQDIIDGDFVGGDLEFTNDENIMHRGPVIAIRLDPSNDMIIIDLEWIAIMDYDAGEWATAPDFVEPCLSFPTDWSRPNEIGNGRIHFSVNVPMVMSMRATLFPRGGSKLDLERVADRVYDPLEA